MLSLHALAFMEGMCDSEICYVVLCAIVANSCALLDRKFNKVKCAILELKVTNLSVTNLTVLNFP